MEFSDIGIKNIDCLVRYETDKTSFSSVNKPHHIMGIQTNGRALHTFKDKSFTLEENCVYFLNQAEDYDVICYEKCNCFSVHFQTYFPVDTPSFCIKVGSAYEYVSILEKAEKKFFSENDKNGLMSDVYRLCSKINDAYNKKYRRSDKRIVSATDYMNINFNKPDCLMQATALSGMSSRRFCDLFKSYNSVTPNRYVTLLKINYAKKLLASKQFSITKISELCGFSDIYYFCKVFKAETDLTPGRFADTVKNE